MTQDKAWLDARTLPPGSKQRIKLAMNCREGVDPKEAIADWGEYDEDYDPAYVNSDHNADHITYYQHRRAEDITILKRVK
jgi:hypothetical protein